MEIKILVPENRKSDLDNFIRDCENKGFELQNRGGGHMPNFSGYYATLKGGRWEPNPTTQLQADKSELLEGADGNNNGWVRVTDSLPNSLQTVFISNGKGYTAMGCLVESEDGFHWAESNGVIYEENGEIVSECESDDIEVNFWHPLPKTPKF